jgi:hypothetical protein
MKKKLTWIDIAVAAFGALVAAILLSQIIPLTP